MNTRAVAVLTVLATALIAAVVLVLLVAGDSDGDDVKVLPTSDPATFCNGVVIPPGADPCPTSDPANPVLYVAGDIASCDSEGDEATADLLNGLPGTVLIAGDVAYETGSEANFSNCFDSSWGRHKNRTRPVPGNHEYSTAGASGYFAYFGEAAGDPGKGYYAFDAGPWRVLMLNSECEQIGGCDETSPQTEWLRAELADDARRCVLAVWHKPRLAAGTHAGENPQLLPLWQAAYDGGVDLVVNGHDHNYQRYGEMNRSLDGIDEGRGVREIVVGTGGKDITDIDPALAESTAGLEEWADVPGDGDGRDAAFGVLKLTLRADSYDWEFLPVAGESYTDKGTANCN